MKSSTFNAGKEIVMVEGVFLRETEKANLIQFAEVKDPVWLPISQMPRAVEITDVQSGDCVVLIPRWLAEKNKLVYEPYNIEEEEGGLAEEYLDDRDSYASMYELE